MVRSVCLRMLIATFAFGLVGEGSASQAHTSNVRPLDACHSPNVDGNASPQLLSGWQGRIAVIARGQYGGGQIPIVVRNNTATKLLDVSVQILATTPSGTILATGASQGRLHPFSVRPDEISFGYVHFPGWARAATRVLLAAARVTAIH